MSKTMTMKNFNPKWFYFLVMIVIVFAIMLISSIGYFAYITLRFKKNIDLIVEDDQCVTNDEIIGFVAAKNSSSLRKHTRSELSYHLFTDERGARVNSSGIATSERVTFLTIGCSCSWGHGIENENTFTEVLGRKLGVSVANFALGSYGTLQSLQILERNLDLAPKVIIYGFIEDAIRRSLAPCAPSYAPVCLSVSYVAFDKQGNPYIHAPDMNFSADLTQKFYEEVVWGKFGIKYFLWGAKITWYRLTTRNMYQYSDTEESRAKCMSFLMKRMSDLARNINAVLIVVHIPYLEKGYITSAPTELINSLSEDTIFLDLSPMVRAYYNNPENLDLLLPYDGHPNELVHALIANEIEKIIMSNNISLK